MALQKLNPPFIIHENCLFLCLPVCLSVYLFVCLFVCLSILSLFACLLFQLRVAAVPGVEVTVTESGVVIGILPLSVEVSWTHTDTVGTPSSAIY